VPVFSGSNPNWKKGCCRKIAITLIAPRALGEIAGFSKLPAILPPRFNAVLNQFGFAEFPFSPVAETQSNLIPQQINEINVRGTKLGHQWRFNFMVIIH
jgi:hypothetical protein